MSQKDRMLEGRICKRFIDTYFHPAPDEYGGDFTYLHLPLLFSDNDGVAFIVQHKGGGKFRITDDYEIAFHQNLTYEQVKTLCDRYDLNYRFDYPEDKEPPVSCEIYAEVESYEEFDKVVWRLIMLLFDSYDVERWGKKCGSC